MLAGARAPAELGAALATLVDAPLVLTSVFETGRVLERGDDGTFWDDSRDAARYVLESVRDDLLRSHPALGAEIAEAVRPACSTP